MGWLYVDNLEWGVYCIDDGGVIWEQVLYFNDFIGVIDLVLYLYNFDIIYVVIWEWVCMFGYYCYGGNSFGIYCFYDGGDIWEYFINGLLGGVIGCIGLALLFVNL